MRRVQNETNFVWDGENLRAAGTAVIADKGPAEQKTRIAPALNIAVAERAVEQALDKVLGVLGSKSEPVAGKEPESKETLFEPRTKTLSTARSPIYPDGRIIRNPNHLMFFLQNDARITMVHRAMGTQPVLVRVDGKRNPVAPEVVEVLVKSGRIRQVGDTLQMAG